MHFVLLMDIWEWLSSSGGTIGRYIQLLLGGLAYVLTNSIFWIVWLVTVAGVACLLALAWTGFLSQSATAKIGGVRNGQEEM